MGDSSTYIPTGFSEPIETLLEKGFEGRINSLRTQIEIGEILHEKYGVLNLKTTLPTFLPPEFYIFPDELEINNTTEWLMLFLFEFGFDNERDSVKLRKLAKDMVTLCYFGFPKTIDPSSEYSYKMKLFCAYCTLGTWMDDLIEATNLLGSSTQLLHQVHTLFVNIAEGTYSRTESLPILYPFLQPSLKGINGIFLKLAETIPNFYGNHRHFILEVLNTFTALGILQTFEEDIEANNKGLKDEVIPQKSFEILRRYDGAVKQLIELWALLADVHIEPHIRKSFLFQELMTSCSNYCAATNEIIGIKKDLENLDIKNYIIYRTEYQNLSLDESFQKRSEEAQDEFNNFIYLSKKLRNFYPDNNEVNIWLLMLGFVTDSHGQLLAGIERYKATKITLTNI